MGAARVELWMPINEDTVEEAYRRAKQAQEARRESAAMKGMRAARERDPKLMLVLEQAAEVLQKMSARQFGPGGMDIGGLRVEATEYNLWREAYKAADEGQALPQLQWIYAAAAWLAGIII